MSAPLQLDVADAVARITLSGGAIDLPWAQALVGAATEAREREAAGEVRVVRVASTGRFFCPGGDLAWMQAQPDPAGALLELATTLHDGLLVLAGLDSPVVGEVAGTAAGAGLSLVLGCDLAYAGASATFTLAYTGVGLSPDGGSSWLLPRLVGRRRAAEIMLVNPRLGAEEAAACGIVTRTVPDEELTATVDGVVAGLAAGPTASYGAIKRLLASSSQTDFADQLALEARSIAELAASPTGQEGIGAFLAKRRPAFPPPNGSGRGAERGASFQSR